MTEACKNYNVHRFRVERALLQDDMCSIGLLKEIADVAVEMLD